MKPPNFSAVILAAGLSTRFGSPKQLAVFRGKPMLQHVIDEVNASNPAEIAVVVPEDLDPKTFTLPETAIWKENPDPKAGLGSSISLGLGVLQKNYEFVLVVLGDQPLVTHSHLNHLVSKCKSGPGIVASTYEDGSHGVPAVFGRAHHERLKLLQGDRGAKSLMDPSSAHLVLIDLPQDSGLDVDTPEDLRRLESY